MMTSSVKRWMVAGLVLLACGCTKLTYERWETVHIGTASPEVVKATLGDPWKVAYDTWVYSDTDRGITAMIKFRDEKVVGKTWADVDRGMETAGEQPDMPGDTEEVHVREIK